MNIFFTVDSRIKWRVTSANSDTAQKLSKTKTKQKVDSQKEMYSRDGGGETLVCQGMWRDFLHRCTRSARSPASPAPPDINFTDWTLDGWISHGAITAPVLLKIYCQLALLLVKIFSSRITGELERQRNSQVFEVLTPNLVPFVQLIIKSFQHFTTTGKSL